MTPFGPSLPEEGWVPAPRYAMRRARIMEVMSERAPGRLIEVGCGSGALLREFAQRGFDVVGLETSPKALGLARLFAQDVENMTICESAPEGSEQRYDYLFSFEVLEHIEDDVTALQTWAAWLRPGGMALISVPARMELWGASDVFVGHFRRYSRTGVSQLLRNAGFTGVQVECYGFPLSNMIEPIRNAHHARIMRSEAKLDKSSATARSGIERSLETRLFPIVARFPGRYGMRLALELQRRFRNRDLGTGYLAFGYKPDRSE